LSAGAAINRPQPRIFFWNRKGWKGWTPFFFSAKHFDFLEKIFAIIGITPSTPSNGSNKPNNLFLNFRKFNDKHKKTGWFHLRTAAIPLIKKKPVHKLSNSSWLVKKITPGR